METDVALDGGPAPERLVVTPVHLAAEAEGVTLRRVPWPAVAEVRTTAGLGGGTLQAKVDGAWIDVVRYSNALATRFHKVSRALERSREALAGGQGGGLAVLDGPLDPPRTLESNL